MFPASSLLSVSPKLRLFVGISVWLLAEGYSIAKPWRGIVPLHTSRTAVHDVLGKPTRQAEYSSSFELPNEIVEVLFAKGGPYGTTMVDSWLVARDIGVHIRVIPRDDVKFQTQKSLAKVEDPDTKGNFPLF